MREILFRGKRKSGLWCYGDLLNYADDYKTIINKEDECIVIPETIGQYTGLKDKNGKMIFEGDILKICEYGKTQNFVVLYGGGKFRLCFPENNVPSCFLEIWSPGLEVVGNAHDNPELLK